MYMCQTIPASSWYEWVGLAVITNAIYAICNLLDFARTRKGNGRKFKHTVRPYIYKWEAHHESKMEREKQTLITIRKQLTSRLGLILTSRKLLLAYLDADYDYISLIHHSKWTLCDYWMVRSLFMAQDVRSEFLNDVFSNF